MNGVPRIISIVEGEVERAALPILIERIASLMIPPPSIAWHSPIRTRRDSFPRSGYSEEREKILALARQEATSNDAILVLLDSDGEPPCRHGRGGRRPLCLFEDDLIREIRYHVPHHPLAVIWANRMYESWFLAAAPSLSDPRLFRQNADLSTPTDPEAVTNPKDWIEARMLQGLKYKVTRDQPRLTHRLNLQMARSASPSFDYFYREIERLIGLIAP